MLKVFRPEHPMRVAQVFLCLVSLSLILLTACKKDAVTDVAQNNQSPQTTPILPTDAQGTVAAATPVSAVSPSAAPATSPTAGASPSASPVAKLIETDRFPQVPADYTFGVKATPTPTPAPTPPVEMVEGKIKQQWAAPAEFASLKSPLKVSRETIQKGKELYGFRCAMCHGDEGKGNGGYNDPKWKQATNLTSRVVQANSDGELFYKVTNGRDRHPASRERFSDEERWMIVAFLRTLK